MNEHKKGCPVLRTKFQLMEALFGFGCQKAKIAVVATDVGGAPSYIVSGILQSVEREDGSGSSFNLKILKEDGLMQTVFWRSID